MSLLEIPVERQADAADDGYAAAFLLLSRQVAHDFNNVWALIFGLVQQAKDMPGFQERDEVLGRITLAASSGLMFSRSLVDILMGFGARAETFDLCQIVRKWAYTSSEILQDAIDISCLVPPHPLHVRFDESTLRLILLSLVGYALRSNETKRWAMIGVRSSGEGKQAQSVPQDCLDLMFLCRLADYRGQPPDHFQKRVNAIRTLAARHAGVVETWVVPQVGVNLRIRLPVAAAPTAGQAGSM
jgi:hypothetical protein